MAADPGPLLIEQLTWHWNAQLRPGLDGLTDDEYRWEPATDCWSVRRRGEARTPMAAGRGDWVVDWQFPEPDPPPVTTIAWRMAHLTIGVFGMRNANHFGGPPMSYEDAEYPPDAARALASLDEGYARWIEGISALDDDGLARAIGPSEGPYAEYSFLALIAHINREVIHHGAELLLLRDLYRANHAS